jgi:hypothetical protein
LCDSLQAVIHPIYEPIDELNRDILPAVLHLYPELVQICSPDRKLRDFHLQEVPGIFDWVQVRRGGGMDEIVDGQFFSSLLCLFA